MENSRVEECQALVKLYEGTDGDRWQDNSGWLVYRKPCNWYGTKCQQGHVVELELYYDQLSGSLPPEIGNFAHLKTLYLDFQNGSGVHFISHYSQEVVGQLTKDNIFYTFQGLTGDGAYYVAAFSPSQPPG